MLAQMVCVEVRGFDDARAGCQIVHGAIFAVDTEGVAAGAVQGQGGWVVARGFHHLDESAVTIEHRLHGRVREGRTKAGEVRLVAHQSREVEVLRVFLDDGQHALEYGGILQASAMQAHVDLHVDAHARAELASQRLVFLEARR